MQGNVSEWCSDWYNRLYYEYSALENPLGPTIGTDRITRGSNFLSKSYEKIGFFEANSAFRAAAPTETRYPFLGFRLALGPLPKENYKSQNTVFVDSIEMVYVEGGKFTMGFDDRYKGILKHDGKKHDVKLNSFYIGKYEITKAQWMAIMHENSKEIPECANCPIDSISLGEIMKFTMKLNQKTGKRYRLPTEAEWEYAARGGKQGRGFDFSGGMALDSIAWHYLNSEGKLQPVGQKVANELGIYDMNGNVSELCSDVYDPEYYNYSEEENPQGPGMKSEINPFTLESEHLNYNYQVKRGGEIRNDSYFINVYKRSITPIGPGMKCLGFRLVLEP
jgi:formylglycine-generating enzyme required for sulfatase activity